MKQARYRVTDIVDGVRAAELVKSYGSPLYVYSEAIIKSKIEKLLHAAQGFKVSYALKANTNSHLVRLIKKYGIGHIDTVSPGQIAKALHCGYKPEEIMYTQNFISDQQIDYALKVGVTLNIGALETLVHHREKLRGKRIFARVNPKVGAGTSHHVITGGPQSKFGVYGDKIDQFIKVAKENDIHIIGIHEHIGSNLKRKDQEVFLETLAYITQILPKFGELEEINIGGGLGVAYQDSEEISEPQYLLGRVRQMAKQWQKINGKPLRLSLEPGRFIVADSAVLLCTITARKSTPQVVFYGTDTGFNHLIRPALYGSHHQIVNLTNSQGQKEKVTVCGNICECTDILGTDVQLSGNIGDILGIENVGAYGFAMSSNYNQRPRPAQVLLNLQNKDVLIRRRQTFEDLVDKL